MGGARIKTWSTGEPFSASDVNLYMIPISAYKSSDTSRNSTTTLTADPDLTISLQANIYYEFTGAIHYNGVSDLKVSWTVPSGVLNFSYCSPHFATTSAVVVVYGLGANQWAAYCASTSTHYGMWFKGVIEMGDTAGDLTFNWAQNTSSATNTTVEARSHIVARRMN